MTEQFTSQASFRLDEKFQCVLFSVGPVGYHKRMTLQERPEANGRNPYVDVLTSLDFYGPRHSHPDCDRLIDISDEGSWEMATPCLVPKYHDAALKGEQCGEYPCEYVDINPDEVGLEYNMPYNGIHYKYSESLVRAEEDLVGAHARPEQPLARHVQANLPDDSDR